jgi:hypothetical protein
MYQGWGVRIPLMRIRIRLFIPLRIRLFLS